MTIQGVHCYDILANLDYCQQFQYVPCDVEGREKYIIDDDNEEGNDEAQSDLVKLALNLAYMTEERAVKFSFDKDAYKDIRGSIGKALGLN